MAEDSQKMSRANQQALAIAYAIQKRNQMARSQPQPSPAPEPGQIPASPMAHPGPVMVVAHPHVSPMAVAMPLAHRVIAKRMAEGGLDDDAPPLYSAYMASSSHLSGGGEVGPEEDEDMDFLEPGSEVDGDTPSQIGSNEDEPEPDSDNQEKSGNEILRSIMNTIRRKHAGR